MLNLETTFWLYVTISLLGVYSGAVTALYVRLKDKNTKLTDTLTKVRDGLKQIAKLEDHPVEDFSDVKHSKWYEYYKVLNNYTVNITYEKVTTSDWYAECFIYYDGSTIFAEVIMDLDDLISMSADTSLLERHVLNELIKRYDVDAVRYITFDYIGDRAEIAIRSKNYHSELHNAFVGANSINLHLYKSKVKQGQTSKLERAMSSLSFFLFVYWFSLHKVLFFVENISCYST